VRPLIPHIAALVTWELEWEPRLEAGTAAGIGLELGMGMGISDACVAVLWVVAGRHAAVGVECLRTDEPSKERGTRNDAASKKTNMRYGCWLFLAITAVTVTVTRNCHDLEPNKQAATNTPSTDSRLPLSHVAISRHVTNGYHTVPTFHSRRPLIVHCVSNQCPQVSQSPNVQDEV